MCNNNFWLYLLLCCSCAALHPGLMAQQRTVYPDTLRRFEKTPFWKDEFNKDGLPDTIYWTYDTGGNGWGNSELEYYTRAGNALVKNGRLLITAKKEATEDNSYTSARLVTKNKVDFLYGRVEVRAKLPSGKGLWPAIWLLPTKDAYGSWPRSGEIDLMEQVGFEPENIHVSVHTETFNHIRGTQKTAVCSAPSATTAFHIYRLDWLPGLVKAFIDNQEVFRFADDAQGAAHWPFDQPFHLLLNLAVGGNWGGQKGIDDAVFPATLEVDYVRLYRLQQY